MLEKSSDENISDTTLFRFYFISDDTDIAREGWMIDDIVLYAADIGTGSIELKTGSKYFNLFPNPSDGNFYLTF